MGSAAGLTAEGLKGLHAAAEGYVADDRVAGLVALVAHRDIQAAAYAALA